MVDFIYMGFIDLLVARTENYKMKKNSCPQSDSNPGPFAYEATSLSVFSRGDAGGLSRGCVLSIPSVS